MGKGKKIRSSTGDVVTGTTLPLDQQIERAKTTKQRDKQRVKDRIVKKQKEEDDQVRIRVIFSSSGRLFFVIILFYCKFIISVYRRRLEREDFGRGSETETANRRGALWRFAIGQELPGQVRVQFSHLE
jgi:hypothetical protein